MESIAVVRLGGWADTTLANFVVPALKEKFPEAKITLVLGRSLADWAVSLQFDDVMLIDDGAFYSKNAAKRTLEFARAAAALRLRRFDLGLSLHSSPIYGALLKLAGIKQTLGFATKGAKTGFLSYDEIVFVDRQTSEIDRYLALLSHLGVKPQKLNFKLRVRQDVQDAVMKRLAADEFRSKGYLAVGPGGGENVQRKFFHKRWTYFAEFLKLFCEKSGLPVLLLGGPGDRDLAAALTYVNPQRIKSWIGKTTREEALAVVAESYAYVGCDSGLSHIAGSVGVPSVVLYGPTSSRQHHPPGVGKTLVCLDATMPCSPCYSDEGIFNWTCRDNVCMKSISPHDVWRSLSRISGMPDGKL